LKAGYTARCDDDIGNGAVDIHRAGNNQSMIS